MRRLYSGTVPAVSDGRYESWYVKASHPSEPLGVWIRYTVHQRPGEQPTGSLWFTLFGPEPRAAKVTPAPEALSQGGGAHIRIGDAELAEGRVTGSALDARWELTFESDEPELRHLPREWMYKAPVPRTKLVSPHPAARFSGEVSFGDRRVQLDAWPGMVGHNWGAQHAERWIWMNALGFEGRANDTWLDVAIGRIKVGGWTVPWVANGVLCIEGERHRIGGIERVRSTKVDESPQRARFRLPGGDLSVEGEVSAPREWLVGWIYADPDGSEHHTVNCSIAEMTLTVSRRGAPAAPPLKLRTSHGAAYELGMRERDHGIPIQPFPDG
jgi:hypothetical protein